MATIVTPTSYTFFDDSTTGASEIVGYESSSERGIRYTFQLPASCSAGATSYSFTKTGNGHYLGTSGLRWNWAVSTDASAYLNTIKAGDGYANAAATFKGSATKTLYPNTTYYLFIYPGVDTYGCYFWNGPTSAFTLTVDGSITYTISYDANGGTNAPAADTKTHGTALTLKTTKPTRASTTADGYKVTFNANGGTCNTSSLTAKNTTSYSFNNWNTAKNGSGSTYNSGASYTTNAAATLYAQWNTSTSKGSITLPTASRTGYIFKGWGTSTSSTTAMTGQYTPSGDITLYAIWEGYTLTVIYNSNGGTQGTNPTYTLPHSTSAKYGSKYNGDNGLWDFKTFNLTKSGYKATYWNTKADGSGISIDQSTAYTAQALAQEVGQDLSKGNVTINFYPLWEPNGLAHIANNSGDFEPYTIHIYNGSSWDQYIPYIYDGTNWILYS